MKQIKAFIVGFCLVFALLSSTLYGQDSYDLPATYSLFDDTIGNENTNLYQGIVYKEQYRVINEFTHFFGNSNFNKGKVQYNGQPYYEEDLKYSVYNDELLLKVRDQVGGITIQLIKPQIESFNLLGHNFKNINQNDAIGMDSSGFFELAVSNTSFDLYIKHVKKSFDKKDRSALYYEFKEGKGKYYIFYKERYYRIKSKKDMITLFPEKEKEIEDFYQSTKNLRKNDMNQFMIALMNKLSFQI